MEQKCDTMFDIVQNLVKELKAVKTACQEQSGGVIDPLMSQFVTHKDIMVDEDDSDDSDDDEDDDEDEDDDDDDDATAVDSVKIINMDIGSKIDIIEIKSDSDSEEAAIELDVEEPVPTIHKIESTSVDYKKLTVAELKQIVSSQGLTTNAHKLTKTELLKLLEK
jgi:hypothetical protein